jgi:hypothetical protein
VVLQQPSHELPAALGDHVLQLGVVHPIASFPPSMPASSPAHCIEDANGSGAPSGCDVRLSVLSLSVICAHLPRSTLVMSTQIRRPTVIPFRETVKNQVNRG